MFVCKHNFHRGNDKNIYKKHKKSLQYAKEKNITEKMFGKEGMTMLQSFLTVFEQMFRILILIGVGFAIQ